MVLYASGSLYAFISKSGGGDKAAEEIKKFCTIILAKAQLSIDVSTLLDRVFKSSMQQFFAMMKNLGGELAANRTVEFMNFLTSEDAHRQEFIKDIFANRLKDLLKMIASTSSHIVVQKMKEFCICILKDRQSAEFTYEDRRLFLFQPGKFYNQLYKYSDDIETLARLVVNGAIPIS